MDVLVWILIAILWFPAGYLGARLLNATFVNREIIRFDWKRSTSNSQAFGLGILLGGITFTGAIVAILFILIFIIFFLFALILLLCFDGIISFLSYLLNKTTIFFGRFAPKN